MLAQEIQRLNNKLNNNNNNNNKLILLKMNKILEHDTPWGVPPSSPSFCLSLTSVYTPGKLKMKYSDRQQTAAASG